MHPCIYCNGYKCDEHGNKTGKCAHDWFVGRTRTPRLVKDKDKELKDKAREMGWTAKRAKKERQHFDSVIGEPLRLQDGTDDVPILLLVPPDPLHFVKLGKLLIFQKYLCKGPVPTVRIYFSCNSSGSDTLTIKVSVIFRETHSVHFPF